MECFIFYQDNDKDEYKDFFGTSSDEEGKSDSEEEEEKILSYDDDFEELQSYGMLKYPIYFTKKTFTFIKSFTWGLCCRKK